MESVHKKEYMLLVGGGSQERLHPPPKEGWAWAERGRMRKWEGKMRWTQVEGVTHHHCSISCPMGGVYIIHNVTVTNQDYTKRQVGWLCHHFPTLSYTLTHAHKCACVHAHSSLSLHITHYTPTPLSFTLIPPVHPIRVTVHTFCDLLCGIYSGRV